MADKVRVAIVGLGFGAEFIPIFRPIRTPRCTPSAGAIKAELDKVRRPLRHQDPLHRLRRPAQRPERRRGPHQLADPRPRRRRAIAALQAGKHVACTVPMATDIEECQADRRVAAHRPARST